MTGSRHPVLLGPMRLISLGGLAAAVSSSGGFGQIAASGLPPERLREEIRKARELTYEPIGVNIPVYRPNAFDALEVAVEEGIKTVSTSAGDPGKLVGRIKEAGLKVLHKCATVHMAKNAERAGVDGVIVSGAGAGGHVGREETSLLLLLPQIADAIDIPIVAAGGIADGRSVLAALALGAEGVEIGTRFLATTESPISEGYKRRILEAGDDGTTVIGRSAMPIRVLRNLAADRIAAMEREGASREAINAYADEFYCHEDPDKAIMPAGQGAGVIRNVLSVRDVMDMLIREARFRYGRIGALLEEGSA